MTKIRFTLTAAAILAALTLCGCTDQKTDYNYDLIGGELNSDNEYTVDIRKDASDVTNDISSTDNTSSSSDISVADDTNISDEQNSTVPTAPTSEPEAAASSSDTDVTTPSAQPAAPTQSSQQTETSEPTPDASKSEPTSSADTATSETSKPSISEKKDTTSNTTQKYDENGFPANPEPFQSFTDVSGQRWEYDNFAGWCKAGGGGVIVTDFWTGEVL